MKKFLEGLRRRLNRFSASAIVVIVSEIATDVIPNCSRIALTN
ncbi:MAG: hypothetical protein ACKO4S_11455 [Snowella sp.]